MFKISETSGLANLRNGDSMNQPEFHSLYLQAQSGFKAELLNGVVFVREPIGLDHARWHSLLNHILATYRATTVGIEVVDAASVILGKKDEVQPDVTLRILPEFGGRSSDILLGDRQKFSYVQGAPELVAEIAPSSRAVDLHLKKLRYTKAGVVEYIVFCVEPSSLQLFELQTGSMITADELGVVKSRIFPGLWLDEKALLTLNFSEAINTLQLGMASTEYAEFARNLRLRKP